MIINQIIIGHMHSRGEVKIGQNWYFLGSSFNWKLKIKISIHGYLLKIAKNCFIKLDCITVPIILFQTFSFERKLRSEILETDMVTKNYINMVKFVMIR